MIDEKPEDADGSSDVPPEAEDNHPDHNAWKKKTDEATQKRRQAIDDAITQKTGTKNEDGEREIDPSDLPFQPK